MKVMPLKTMFGTLAAAGLLAIGVVSCSKKEATPLEKAKIELQEAREKYTKDSLDFVNSDSIEAREKLAILLGLKACYLGFKNWDEDMRKDCDSLVAQGKINDMSYAKYKADPWTQILLELGAQSGSFTKDNNVAKMDSAIDVAKANIDIATGKIFNQTKEKLAKTEVLVKAEEIMEKELNNEPITMEERYFAAKVLNTHILDSMVETEDRHITNMLEFLKKIAITKEEKARKDSIMHMFNKFIAEKN